MKIEVVVEPNKNQNQYILLELLEQTPAPDQLQNPPSSWPPAGAITLDQLKVINDLNQRNAFVVKQATLIQDTVDSSLKYILDYCSENGVDDINQRARTRVISLVSNELDGDLKSKKIAVLGAAFKPDSDDVRDSPALDIARGLTKLGAKV